MKSRMILSIGFRGSRRTAGTAVLMFAALISCAFLISGCNIVRNVEPPENTALPDAGETASGTEQTPFVTQTKSAEPIPVTPLPGTPEDLLNDAEYPVTEELKLELDRLLNIYGRTVEGIYNVFNDPAEGAPVFYYDSDDKTVRFPGCFELAAYMLEEWHGVCYHFASLTCYLLREAGFEAVLIYGYRPYDNALHYWTMVRTDQGWYHFDPLHKHMLLTDRQKSGEDSVGRNAVVWQQGIWPESANEPYGG